MSPSRIVVTRGCKGTHFKGTAFCGVFSMEFLPKALYSEAVHFPVSLGGKISVTFLSNALGVK